jgi:type II secretory pathway pseudopilin PulG
MMRRQRGFTLLEAVFVIVIAGSGFMAISSLFAMAVRTLPLNERLQSAGQLAQGCAERILSARHTAGFVFGVDLPTLESNFCILPDASHALEITEASAASGVCPTGMTCRHLTITVARVTPPQTSVQLDLLLVQP